KTNLEHFRHGEVIEDSVWEPYFSSEVQNLIKETLIENQGETLVITGGTVYKMIAGCNSGSDIDIMANERIIETLKNKTEVRKESNAIQVSTPSGDELDLLNSNFFSQIGVSAIKRYFSHEKRQEIFKRYEQGELLERDLFQLFPWETMKIQFGLDENMELEAKFHDPNNYIEEARLVDEKIIFPGFHENAVYGEMLHQLDRAITYGNTIRYPEPRPAIWAMTNGIRLASTACVLGEEVITSLQGDERLGVFKETQDGNLTPNTNQHYFNMMARIIKHVGNGGELFFGEEVSANEINEIMKQQSQKHFAKAALNDPARAYEYFFQVFEAGEMILPQIQRNFDAFHENFLGISNNVVHLLENADDTEDSARYIKEHLAPELLKDKGVISLLKFKSWCEEEYGSDLNTAKHPTSMSEIVAFMYLANNIAPEDIEETDAAWWKLEGTMKPSNPRYTNAEFDSGLDFQKVKRIMREKTKKTVGKITR
ncbi:hypothetical protein KC660_01655, partial [Candidatus Dojkabacteria bacterium]|nr:hypothetical protein [Candidatus Dojkabacteria bacterium]